MEVLSLVCGACGIFGLRGYEFCDCLVLGCGGNRLAHRYICVHRLPPGNISYFNLRMQKSCLSYVDVLLMYVGVIRFVFHVL